jgi:hypothetical protein
VPGLQPFKPKRGRPSKDRVNDPAVKPRTTRQRQRGVKQIVLDLSKQKVAVELKIRGATYAQIAEHLGVAEQTAKLAVSRGLQEYYDDHHEVVHRYLGINLARYDALMRAWLPKALGGQRQERRADGTMEVITMEPNGFATKVVLEALRDMGRLLGNGQTLHVEHSGPNSGPIMTAAVDAMEAARAVRAAFGDAAARAIPTLQRASSNLSSREPDEED